MKPLEITPELREVARRVVWFIEPDKAFDDPVVFLAHVMTYGDDLDIMQTTKADIGLNDFNEVLDKAPPGIFDKKSWTYWHLKCKHTSPPPLPVRTWRPS